MKYATIYTRRMTIVARMVAALEKLVISITKFFGMLQINKTKFGYKQLKWHFFVLNFENAHFYE